MDHIHKDATDLFSTFTSFVVVWACDRLESYCCSVPGTNNYHDDLYVYVSHLN